MVASKLKATLMVRVLPLTCLPLRCPVVHSCQQYCLQSCLLLWLLVCWDKVLHTVGRGLCSTK